MLKNHIEFTVLEELREYAKRSGYPTFVKLIDQFEEHRFDADNFGKKSTLYKVFVP
jgi:hypothetical protein